MSNKRDIDWCLAFAAAVGVDSGLHAPITPDGVKDCLEMVRAKARQEPVWKECLCAEIDPADRPCIVCAEKAKYEASNTQLRDQLANIERMCSAVLKNSSYGKPEIKTDLKVAALKVSIDAYEHNAAIDRKRIQELEAVRDGKEGARQELRRVLQQLVLVLSSALASQYHIDLALAAGHVALKDNEIDRRVSEELLILRKLERKVFAGNALACSPEVVEVLNEYADWARNK